MAKTLLWIFVVLSALISWIKFSNGIERDWIDVYQMWIAIGVIAICESVEKTKAKS